MERTFCRRPTRTWEPARRRTRPSAPATSTRPSPRGGELSLGEDEAPSAPPEPVEIIPEPGRLLPSSTAEAVVTYRFIVGDEVVAEQTAQDGDEILRPEGPAAQEGMAFAGWFYMDGEPVFDGDEPVIAATDPLIPEINVFARFIESPRKRIPPPP